MTNGELVKRFIEYYGGKPGDVGNDITPVAPYILMDIAYQSYRKHISQLKVTGLAKLYRTRWSKAYHQFNSQIFLPFNEDEWDAIVDRMDELEAYLSDEVHEVEEAIISFLGDKIGSNRDIIASVLLNNILAQAANELLGIACTKLTGQPAKSRELDAIRIWCLKFASVYIPPAEDVDTSQDERVCAAVNALSKKIVKWLFEQ